VILNDNIREDEDREWTYIGARRQTVIDYALVEGESKDKIESFIVGEKIRSDHQQFIIKLKEGKKRGSKRKVKDERKRGRKRNVRREGKKGIREESGKNRKELKRK